MSLDTCAGVQADGLDRLLKAIDDTEARVQRKGLQVLGRQPNEHTDRHCVLLSS